MRRLLLALLPLLALALPGLSDVALAQGENVMNWRATLPVERVQPRPRQTYQPRLRSTAPVLPRRADDPAFVGPLPEALAPPPVVPEEQRRQIALIGDSLAEALSFGFEADRAFTGEITVRSRLVSAAGLVRDDYHDWPKALGELLAANKDISVIVVMLGLNDRQAIRIGSESLEPLSEGWRAAYRQRVDALLGVARAANLPVVWVGMPVVRLPKFSADLMQINDILRERVQLAGQTWLDIADVFADGAGGFTPTGADVIGDIVRLRGSDGIHFTPAGQRKLAFFAERPVRRIIGERQPSPAAPSPPVFAPDVPPLPEGSPAPQQDASLPAAVPFSSGDLGIPMPNFDGLAISIPRPRPLIGQTRVLNETRPAQSLLGREGTVFADETSRRFFERGLTPSPRPGRSDDYGWR
jgi:uncharacterized protein